MCFVKTSIIYYFHVKNAILKKKMFCTHTAQTNLWHFFFSGSPNEEFHANADIITQCITGNEDCNQQKQWALSPDTSLINLCYLSVIVQITKDALLLLCLCPQNVFIITETGVIKNKISILYVSYCDSREYRTSHPFSEDLKSRGLGVLCLCVFAHTRHTL